jgi:hypothetical protein
VGNWMRWEWDLGVLGAPPRAKKSPFHHAICGGFRPFLAYFGQMGTFGPSGAGLIPARQGPTLSLTAGETQCGQLDEMGVGFGGSGGPPEGQKVAILTLRVISPSKCAKSRPGGREE